MIILEFKAYGKPQQYEAVNEAIQTVQLTMHLGISFGCGWNTLARCLGRPLLPFHLHPMERARNALAVGRLSKSLYQLELMPANVDLC